LINLNLNDYFFHNRYRDGSNHIGEHRDNEPEIIPHAPIASLSFGQARDFVLRHQSLKNNGATIGPCGEPMKVVQELEHGSLLVMRYPTNLRWYHSLPVRKRANAPRINLTFRLLRVKKN
jgi:DNA oxidative demethylase